MRKFVLLAGVAMVAASSFSPVSAFGQQSAAQGWNSSVGFRSANDRAVDLAAAMAMEAVRQGRVGNGTYVSSTTNVANQTVVNTGVNNSGAQDSMTNLTVVVDANQKIGSNSQNALASTNSGGTSNNSQGQ